jgi:hypothetical protein
MNSLVARSEICEGFMSTGQKKILLSGLPVFLLLGLFPPWLYKDENTSNQRSAGYHFIQSPPSIKSYEEMFGIAEDEYHTTRFVRATINIFRLFAQMVAVILLLAGLYGRQMRRHGPGVSDPRSPEFSIGAGMLIAGGMLILFAYLSLLLTGARV